MSNISVLKEYMIALKPYMDQYGYWAVFGAILLESFGIPAPGEATLIVGSLLASQGDLSVFSVVVAAWMAAVVGDNIGYAIGLKGGGAASSSVMVVTSSSPSCGLSLWNHSSASTEESSSSLPAFSPCCGS